jgi:D-glycero-D-manno-heptose 1,7-bisphosphate phosphatase
VFVDRDGTLNPDLRYLKDADRLELFRGVGQALRLVREHGELVVCVTNQSGIDRGLYAAEDVERIHQRLNELLGRAGARIDAFYYCPHAPERNCACRKPGIALFERARAELGLDLATSAIVGDRLMDVQAGRALGLFTALVRTPGHEETVDREFAQAHVMPDISAESFPGAIARLLGRG